MELGTFRDGWWNNRVATVEFPVQRSRLWLRETSDRESSSQSASSIDHRGADLLRIDDGRR